MRHVTTALFAYQFLDPAYATAANSAGEVRLDDKYYIAICR
jgi:hypothetical protein